MLFYIEVIIAMVYGNALLVFASTDARQSTTTASYANTHQIYQWVEKAPHAIAYAAFQTDVAQAQKEPNRARARRPPTSAWMGSRSPVEGVA